MAGFQPHKDPCGKMYHNGRLFDLCGRQRHHAEDVHEGFGQGLQWRIEPNGTKTLISRGDSGTPGPLAQPQEYRRAGDRSYDPVMLPEPSSGFAGPDAA